MLQIFCGDGKGKTSAAVGSAVRACGAGRKVMFVQFMKGAESAETEVLSALPRAEVCRSPKEFPFYENMTKEEKKELTEIHNRLLEKIVERLREDGSFLIVMDELTYAMQWDLIELDRVMELCKTASGNTDKLEVIVTGREPMEGLLDLADYISRIGCEKHPFTSGIPARKGIEY